MAESDRLLSDCTPLKGVPRVRIPLSPPFFLFPPPIFRRTGSSNFVPFFFQSFLVFTFTTNPVDIFRKVDRMAAHCPEGWMRAKWADLREGCFPVAAGREN